LGTLAAGPWLLVNEGLKEHSGRPRPGHVAQFGGKAEFRPFGRFDGSCATNCSFVSGEAAAAAWTLAPALLAPPPWRAAAVAASLVFTLATSALRMAFGGHFLSDALFAALFVWLIVLASRPRRRED
jgi:membrane-associated phospholipid phosphatase